MPPTTDETDDADELRDAAANLRRLANGENLAEVYPEFTPHNVIGALCCDRGTVAHAWLAANPPDAAPLEGKAAAFRDDLEAESCRNSGGPDGDGPKTAALYQCDIPAILTPWRFTPGKGTPGPESAVMCGVTRVGDCLELSFDTGGRSKLAARMRVSHLLNVIGETPWDDLKPVDAAWLAAIGGDDERGDGDRAWPVGAMSRLCVGQSRVTGVWHCWVREGSGDGEESVTMPPLESRGQLRRLLAALGVPSTR